ncbi:unnamed protein product [Paramecium primaurelia]|uniref:Uncharacterized protein n=1 Tax=Paramecium primaurelia TaxID=5886 RepID=A0A8S1KH66_PARPR|nr:unnamed protein product [Paramecium primaurelia]
MNWRKTKVFKSFTIQGALIESLYDGTSKQLILYDTQNIKIYGVGDSEIKFYDKIQLFTQIKKIVFLSSFNHKYLVVQNIQGQISAISIQYPYDHKLVILPEHFTSDAQLLASQNRSCIIVQFQNEIMIFELNQKQEFVSHSINIKNQEIKQIDASLDDTLHIMCQQYEQIRENQMIANIESTIFYCKMHYKEKGLQNYKFKFIILQIIALEMEDILALTQNEILCLKNGKTHLAIPAQVNCFATFMKLNQVNNQLFLCNPTVIEIIEIRFDDFNQIMNMVRLQAVQISQIDIVIADNLVWIQTETSGTLNQMNAIRMPSISDLDPSAMKKVKLEENDQLFKALGVFQTFNRIFNFTVVGNSLYILTGNAASSQIYKLQHELTPNITTVSLKIKTGINGQKFPLYFENHIGFISEQKQLTFSKILKDGNFQLVDNIQIPEFQDVFSNGTINANCFYVQFDTYLWFIQTNPLCQFSRQYDIRQVKQLMNYFVGFDEQKSLIVTYLNEKSLISQKINSSEIVSFDLAQQENDILILLIEKEKLSILSVKFQSSQIQIQLMFITNEFMGNICAISTIPELNLGQNAVFTCPSIQIKCSQTENEDIINSYLVNFYKNKGMAIILITSSGKISIYSQIKNNSNQIKIFKLIFSYQSNSVSLKSQKFHYVGPSNFQQIILPGLNLTLTESLGEILIHFIKQEDQYDQVLLVQQNAFLMGYTGSCYYFPQLQRSNLPCNNIIINPVLKDRCTAIMMHSFSFHSNEYLLVINKAQNRRTNQNQLKNEVFVYRSDNLNDPFAQYDQLDNEEIIKVQFLQGMDLILIMTLVNSQLTRDYPNTKLHILKLDQYQKITEQQQSRLFKEAVPCDFVVMPPKLALIFMQDQLKYIDLHVGQSAIGFSLTPDSLRGELVQIQIEAVSVVDRWIAVLNGGFKVVICKFEEDNSQPKVDWSTEFGVLRVMDIQLLKNEYQKPLLVLLDCENSLQIYSITYKTKIKKIADCQIMNPCRMLSIANKLIISSLDGSMTMFDQIDDESQANKFKTIVSELPYIGGFQPSSFLYAKQINGKGSVWDFEINDLFNQFSFGIQKIVKNRYMYNPFE